MPSLPEHVVRNRDQWQRWSPDWVEAGRKAWSQDAITWGCWGVPESQVQALGDLELWRGRDVIELGCGTGYFSAWMARLGAKPVGVDITPGQLDSARAFQREFGVEYALIEASAEEVPLPDASFDLAISEYGASIWCDPKEWIPEAARLLKPDGQLVFLRGSTLFVLCLPPSGPAKTELMRPHLGMYRLEWEESDDDSVEFHPPAGEMFRILKGSGFQVENFIEIYAPQDAEPSRFEFVSLEWAQKWPPEEIWVARKAP